MLHDYPTKHSTIAVNRAARGNFLQKHLQKAYNIYLPCSSYLRVGKRIFQY